ncbi:nuclear transport factor 2 family protein [Clostridium sp. D2Q-11]|uniref:Nuclear transport factor 2 family protein n=1 Tax=Anaeromonas frigoriresistens TaxID=2683708 RepID=A0A942Z6E1_9FIRM|nr:nuclear transport factor 2 family protein [Anaeromonas frigoriresistens]MBS4537487.1 nuclear transport factor 2 family protein [Anaeromonas frigoriresistens]
MKKIIYSSILIIFLLISGCTSETSEILDKDEEKIMETALNYIEGWYEGDESRMEEALHPEMIKRRFENGELTELDTSRMVDSTKRGGGVNAPKENFEIEVEVLDKSENIASVVTRSEYIDYLHLAKVKDKWVIVNVLWDMNRN